jgi:hypothetical protein
VADTALELIAQAASHPLLGEYAAYDGNVSVGASTTVFSAADLVSFTNDTRWRTYRAIFPGFSRADLERVVYSTNLAQGQCQFMQPVTTAPANGDRFLLLRDLSWSQWLSILNETVRSLYYQKEVYLRGATTLLKYTLPTPISRPEWIVDVKYGV